MRVLMQLEIKIQFFTPLFYDLIKGWFYYYGLEQRAMSGEKVEQEPFLHIIANIYINASLYLWCLDAKKKNT